jgi:hypothetical protein
MADSISPASVSATIGVGESFTVNKTVTVDSAPTAPVDVFFLADTTGSMGSYIAAVQSSASTILSSTSGLGDVWYGVGEYKDVGDVYVYRLNTSITSNTVDVQSGINLWSASGGGDYPESAFYGLQQAATGAGWRTGSTRILVWFGDAPPQTTSLGVDETVATSALTAADIEVEAIDLFGLNDTGAAQRIANATGGTLFSGINTASLVTTITNAIISAVNSYSTVGLDLSEVPAGVTVTYTPLSYTGSYDRSTTETFDFSVTFTGDTAGVYDFHLYALVDKGRVAAERDMITVGIPEPTTLALLGLGAFGLGFGAYRRRLKK